MIQRPLAVIAAAYLCGICGARAGNVWVWFFLIFFWVAAALLCTWLRAPIFWNRMDRFLIIVPLFFWFGISQLNSQSFLCSLEQDAYLQGKKGVIYGTVTELICGKTTIQMILKDAKTSDGTLFCGNVFVLCPKNFSWEKKWIGSKVEVSGTYKNFSHATNPGQFDEKEYRKALGFCMKFMANKVQMVLPGKVRFEQELAALRRKFTAIYQKLLPEQEAGIILAMLLGERGFLDSEIKQLYQTGGISHILAISGLHLSLLGMGLFHLLRKMRWSLFPASAVSIGVLFFYGCLTGFGVSTKRAFLMMILSFLANYLGCTNDLISSLSLAGIIVLWNRPLLLFQASFLLSFGAVIGIAVFLPLFRRQNSFFSGILTSVAIQLMTIPILLYFFYELPMYSIVLNLIVLPLMSVLAVGAAAAGVIGSIFVSLGVWICGGSYLILKGYEGLCRLIKQLPYSVLTLGRMSMSAMISYYIILFGTVFLCYKKKKRSPAIFLFLLVIPICFPKFAKREGLTVTFLDVGQGDCAFVEDEDGTTMLIDGGSLSENNVGTYRILPFLKERGIHKVDYALVSHADLDHINGILELLEAGKIRRLVLPHTKDVKEVFADMISIAENKNCDVLYLAADDKIKKKSWTIQCLSPERKGVESAAENAASMVLRLDYGKVTFWFMADIEKEGEKRLIQRLENQRKEEISILKVAHHGSKYSTAKELLDKVCPAISIISCAKENSYGHPHKELLGRLKNTESVICQTPLSGAITIHTNGRKVKLQTFCNLQN